MFIKEIEIKNNTRLMIRGTTLIRVNFTEIHQLILGTNGCGKSTLVQELSPLPPQGSDYLKNGYKKVVIEHENKTYTLVSKFAVQAGKHSFIDNETGEEMNQGGTQSVQRTLISEIFNYDQSLHDVLTDQTKFTNMSPKHRRDWLTRISGTNLDFAIELFNKLRRAQRDEEAVVKHLTSRLNKESDDLPSEDDLHTLEARFVNLDKQIKTFYEQRVTRHTLPPDRMFEVVDKCIKDATQLALEILWTDYSFSDPQVTSLDTLKELRSSLQSQVNSDNERIKALNEEHHEISRLLTETQGITDESQLQQLKDRLLECNQEISEYSRQTTLIKECDNAIEINGRALGISDQLLHIATEFVDNTEGYFTKQKRLDTENIINELNMKLTQHNRHIRELEHNISHIKRTDATVCPKCNHTFKAGISESDLPSFEQGIRDHNAAIALLETEKSVHVAYMDEYTIYRNNYMLYMDILNRNKDLTFLNQYIRPIDLLVDAPSLIVNRMNACLNDLDKLASIQRLMPEVYQLEAAIDKVNSVRSNGNYTQERLLKIEVAISELKRRIGDNDRRVLILTREHDKYTDVTRRYAALTTQLDNLNAAIEETYVSNKKQVIERMITNVNTDLAHVNMELNKARNKQNIVDDVARMRDITMTKSNAYKVLVNEINPTTGLIADYFKQFIEQFVEQMNIIINKVWEHNIELLPCDVDSDGLTYKFPLRVNDKPYGPPDGAKGSNSQISMVNFAFKIVVMVYLGLDDYPLYLDELAPDLDEKHRINIISFVRSFVESKRCSQMIMVSHYATGYGAFTNAEILILDDENLIDIPQTYNKHATIVKDDTLIEDA